MAFARASVSFSTTAASVSTPTHSHAPRAARGTSIAASATARDDGADDDARTPTLANVSRAREMRRGRAARGGIRARDGGFARDSRSRARRARAAVDAMREGDARGSDGTRALEVLSARIARTRSAGRAFARDDAWFIGRVR